MEIIITIINVLRYGIIACGIAGIGVMTYIMKQFCEIEEIKHEEKMKKMANRG